MTLGAILTVYAAFNFWLWRQGAAHADLSIAVLQYALVLPALAWQFSRRSTTAGSKTLPRLNVWIPLIVYVVAAIFTTIAFRHGKWIGDEGAYRFQARVFASGHLAAEAPAVNGSAVSDSASTFRFNHLLIHAGHWFAKYPPGWPALLAFPLAIGLEDLINPIFSFALAWLTYVIASRLYNRSVAGVAVGMLVLCPFFWYTSTGYLSHPSCAVMLAAAFVFSMRAWRTRNLASYIVSFTFVGAAFLIRPYTAACFGVVLFIYDAWEARADHHALLKLMGAALLASFWATFVYVGYNFSLTHEISRTPYALYRGTTSIGELDFRPASLLKNLLVVSRWSMESMLVYSFPFVFVLAEAGVYLSENRRHTRLLAFQALSIIGGYVAMTEPSDSYFGERYYYEAYPFVCIVGAVGLEALAQRWRWSLRTARLAELSLFILLIVVSVRFVLSSQTWPQAFRELTKSFPARPRSVLFLKRAPAFEPRDFTDNAADWRTAPVFYVEDPGNDAKRKLVARSLERRDWQVVTYNHQSRRLVVEKTGASD